MRDVSKAIRLTYIFCEGMARIYRAARSNAYTDDIWTLAGRA